MKKNRRGFFAAVAAAIAGTGAVAAAEAGPSLKGVAAKLTPIQPAFPWTKYAWSDPITGTVTQGEAADLKAILAKGEGLKFVHGRIAPGRMVVPDTDKAIAEAVERAIKNGTANGLREALRNL